MEIFDVEALFKRHDFLKNSCGSPPPESCSHEVVITEDAFIGAPPAWSEIHRARNIPAASASIDPFIHVNRAYRISAVNIHREKLPFREWKRIKVGDGRAGLVRDDRSVLSPPQPGNGGDISAPLKIVCQFDNRLFAFSHAKKIDRRVVHHDFGRGSRAASAHYDRPVGMRRLKFRNNALNIFVNGYYSSDAGNVVVGVVEKFQPVFARGAESVHVVNLNFVAGISQGCGHVAQAGRKTVRSRPFPNRRIDEKNLHLYLFLASRSLIILRRISAAATSSGWSTSIPNILS